ncbi:MAG: PhnD/SsuA/transferrin family substrate-binding protein [Methylococcaceae bacterium]|nr:PhnD/SsuA/transferrin family substrate-binding protein [Methylococcaceae bacterium]
MKYLSSVLILWLAIFTVIAAQDERPLKIGVLAFRPKPQTLAQWQPVVDYLQETLERPVELAVYDHPELGAAAVQRAVDVVVTTPNHFILLQHTAGVSAPLATLVSREGMHELSAYGGVIFTRTDRGDITSLADLAGKRIAATTKEAFGSYQMQASEMMDAGVSSPEGDRLLLTGQPNDKVIEAVLSGTADVGFVRTGVLEALAHEGKLEPPRIKVINRQNFPAFPYEVSTRLYPEWPVAVMPQVDSKLASHLAAALFLLPRDRLGASSTIAGFTTPANYAGVDNLMRHLRLPPFDRTPEIKLADLWHRYDSWIIALASLMLLLAATSSGLVILYRRTQHSLRELERMAEKENLILASLAEGVYGVDTQGICIFINPRALAMLGLTESEVIGKEAHHLFHTRGGNQSHHAMATCPVMQTLQDGIKRELEDVFIRPDGTLLPVSLGVAAMHHGKTIVGAVVVFQDITERKRAEEALNRYKDELEETVQQRTAELRLSRDAAEAANKAKSLFLANMSHELRTPLNAILGFSRMMRLNTGLSVSQCENLDIINRSGEHLLKVINDVLEIAKIESGRLQLDIAPFDLGNLMRDVGELMLLRAQQKGLWLKSEQAPEVPRYIKGDEARLRQILLNLVGNAVKFTERGGVTIRLHLKRGTRRELSIEVEDTGPGIAAEDKERLFEPFVQLNAKGWQSGTGLGLAITRQFLQLMGGRIELESTVGKGSLFRVELPVELAGAGEVSARSMDRHLEIVGLAPGQPVYRILIAEDQVENQLLLKRLMEQLGLEVRIADNGEQCIALFQQWQPHLIWMDWRMPVLDGEEATRRIRGLPGGDHVKIVAVTASVFIEQKREMLEVGMDDFVSKPYHFDEIYQCMARVLDIKYRYLADASGEKPSAVSLTTEMLAVLPASLRKTLKDALLSLDSELIDQAIKQAGEADKSLGFLLSRLVDNFDYPVILRLLDELGE